MANNSDDQSANERDNEQAKKPGAFLLSQTPLAGGTDSGEAHKYEAGAQPPAQPDYEDLGALPASYDCDTVFLVARDPRWLFAYWDFDWTKYPTVAMRGGVAQFFLRILHADGRQETVVEITPEARNWYVPVSAPDTLYFGEIGFFARDGGWVAVVTSGVTRTPQDAVADDAAAEFATVPLHLSFDRMLSLVRHHMQEGESLLHAVARITEEGREIAFGQDRKPVWSDEQRALLAALLGHSIIDRMGLGSAELDELLRKQLADHLHSPVGNLSVIFRPAAADISSSAGASWSGSPFKPVGDRSFFMHVNAEVIFYGGTHPDAKVWVDGKEIRLAPDGTFRFHFTLPDGDFSIPISAQSPDGIERRSATLTFARGTAKTGYVTDTAQPPYLQPLIGRK